MLKTRLLYGMRTHFSKNLVQSFYHIVLNQFFGFLLFFILSSAFSKSQFGELNWVLAILLVGFNLLSLGMDTIMVKKLASGEDPGSCVRSYLGHTIFTGFSFFILLFLLHLFNSSFQFYLLIMLATGKLMIHLSMPFKQLALGMERFRYLKWMSVTSNAVKTTLLVAFLFGSSLDIYSLIWIFIIADASELVLSIILGNRILKKNWLRKFSFDHYKKMLQASLHQAAVSIFSYALARFDWILIGLVLPAYKLGEYSFAYKVFELSTLPLLIIAPLLLPLFVRIFGKQVRYDQKDLEFLLRAELVVASFVIIVLNLCWTPVVDMITAGKYGMVNSGVIMVLSLSMPFLYLNNFLWTINFAQGKNAAILKVFIICFFVNVIANLVMVPVFGNEGAAAAYLLAMVTQTLLFLRFTEILKAEKIWKPFLLPVSLAVLIIYTSKMIFLNPWLLVMIAVMVHLFILFLSEQVKIRDWYRLKRIMTW